MQSTLCLVILKIIHKNDLHLHSVTPTFFKLMVCFHKFKKQFSKVVRAQALKAASDVLESALEVIND